ncbi:Surface antigen [Fibrobacter sp. UWB16]|uniref:BamA/TamA family outer membrane protein n=1 Tax=Fibrobacter sp. UWB16 TaxID=1945874 RepID=UPI000BC7D78B|nr:BamA/TamA family outer membrane protein [Fibrobacter sp. UWB16]SOD11615.1 Surface antigen [Fibrobacter sp. UWB16]
MKLWWRNILYVVTVLLLGAVLCHASECRIERVEWVGEHSEFEELSMNDVVGAPCGSWRAAKQKLLRYYEDRGFVGAKLDVAVDSAGVMRCEFVRGSAWVWASSENLDSGATDAEVFAQLTGLEIGEKVSLSDLERSERKLSRLGYYEKTADVRLFRDPVRNRIIPAYSMRAAPISAAEGFLTYSSDENVWEGKINLELFNILGTGRDLQMEGYSQSDSRRLEGSYRERFIFGTAWDVLVRGFFEDDSLSRDSRLELGVSRNVGFNFDVAVFVGIGNDEKSSTFELSYVSFDRSVLPRSGTSFDLSLAWMMDRPDSLDSYLRLQSSLVYYVPLWKNFIVRYSAAAGALLPSGGSFAREDLFSLGGINSFKGMMYGFMRTRAYGFSQAAFLWQDGYDLSIELFYQPGIYRRMKPFHGWAREHDYGIGFTQYRKAWSFSIYYALRNGCDYLDGVLGFGVKTLF